MLIIATAGDVAKEASCLVIYFFVLVYMTLSCLYRWVSLEALEVTQDTPVELVQEAREYDPEKEIVLFLSLTVGKKRAALGKNDCIW